VPALSKYAASINKALYNHENPEGGIFNEN
jgi:hypothetical protein